MEVLDRVYKSFSNLEMDFARSKKTRAEFIRDKFGGDIEIGSMIILDAVSSFNGEETPEDIEKLTFIKDIIADIKSNAGNLDKMHSFKNFGGERPAEEFFAMLEHSEAMGMHQREVPQAELNRLRTGVVHFICTPDGAQYADLNKGKIVHCYNEHMLRLVTSTLTVDGDVSLGDYVQIKSRGHAVVVLPQKVAAALK